ncbi:MAG: hypothetical protein ACKPE3_07115 [Sphaerospermopsis kisseleviana]
MSESGYPGFEDFQDFDFSGNSDRTLAFLARCVFYCLNQDVQDLRMYRMLINYYNYKLVANIL